MAQRTLSSVLCTASVLVAAGGSTVEAANLLPLPSMVSALVQSDDDDTDVAPEEVVADEQVAEDPEEASAPEEAVADEEPGDEAVAEEEPTETAVAEEEELASEDSVASDATESAAPETEEVAEEAAPEPAPPAPAEPAKAPPPAPLPVSRSAPSGGGDDREDNTIYKVVMNHEEQYSIWPADRENALGWNDAGKTGSKQECLDYIKEVWTDMRPNSLRKKMEEMERQQSGQSAN